MSHQYRNLSPEQQEELFSNFLIDSWSYSKISTFARNEKAFEMSYIYRKGYKRSSSEVAGSAYHEALKFYFLEKKDGRIQDLAYLQAIAFRYIDEVEADKWKIQKTTPTIADCQVKATKAANQLLMNFMSEKSAFEDQIKDIVGVELYCDEFVTVNGVDVPLPCHAMIDLVVNTVDDRIVLIDHKTKAAFSDEKELRFSIGKQAITYTLVYEQKSGIYVNEVWFIENKTSENRDKSPQMNIFKIEMDQDIRRLYEALLYEPLKRMIEAISDPDYIYLINENDNFMDKAEIYEFWAQTMMAEVGDFNVPESKKEMITKRLKKIRDVSIATVDPKVIRNFRKNASEFIQYDLTNKDMTNEEKIEHTLRTLGLIVNVAHKFDGYSSDTFLLEINAGINISTAFRYKLDIANALNVPNIRMLKDLFVYQGKSYLAIESTKQRTRDLLFNPKLLVDRKIPIGIDNFDQKVVWDLDNPSTPHMLICGSTGSGKSVCLFTIIEYAKLAGVDNIVIFDPKFEFTKYGNVYNDIEEIEAMMELLVEEMNTLVKKGQKKSTLIIFDEFADAVANSRKGNELKEYEYDYFTKKNVLTGTKKSLEENLRILLQKGRSSGFRIIAATQRASVKVITGDAKVNFPVQICFKVPKEIDSKVVIDEGGAESLAGKGDGLIKSPELHSVVRFQAFYKPN